MVSPHHRPLSPHLGIYKLPITALLSISHRVTGLLLSLGLVLSLVALASVAHGETAYTSLQHCLRTGWGRVFLGGIFAALFLHWSHGIRHLLMDCGIGLEKKDLPRYATWEIGATIVLTLCALGLVNGELLWL